MTCLSSVSPNTRMSRINERAQSSEFSAIILSNRTLTNRRCEERLPVKDILNQPRPHPRAPSCPGRISQSSSATAVDLTFKGFRCSRPIDTVRDQTIGVLEASERLPGRGTVPAIGKIVRQAVTMAHQLPLIALDIRTCATDTFARSASQIATQPVAHHFAGSAVTVIRPRPSMTPL